MKNALIYFSMLLFFTSCKKNIDYPEMPQSEALTTKEKDYLYKNGFDTTQIAVTDSTIIVEGDIVITRSDLKDRIAKSLLEKQQNKILQRRTDFTVNNDRINGIGVYIDPTVPSVWQDAVRWAINEYGLLSNNGGTLRFIQIYNPADADIVISHYYSYASSTIAQANAPSSVGNPGQEIYINTYYAYNSTITYTKMIFTMVHELGHTVGFHHTDNSSAVLIPGTPTTDAGSFMNSVVGNYNGFSTGDKQAVNVLYPLPVLPSQSPKIFGPNQISTSGEGYFVFSQDGDASTIYQWEIVGVNYGGITDSRTQDVYGYGLSVGTYTIRGRALVNNVYTPWASKSFTISN